MRKFTKVVTATALILFGAIYFGAMIYALGNELWILLVVLALPLLFLGIIWFKYLRLYRPGYELVDEMTIATVYHRWTGEFLYYMDETGRYTYQPYDMPEGANEADYDERHKNYQVKYKIPTYRHDMGMFEEIRGAIKKGMVNTHGVEEALRTRDGISIDVTWAADAFVYPVRAIAPQFKMARLLPNPEGLLGKRVKHQLRLLIAEKTIEELFLATMPDSDGSNVIQELEIDLCGRAQGEVSAVGMRLPGNGIRLGPIEFPKEIERELAVVYRRKLEARSLEILREALDSFDDSYVGRYRELERLRIIEKSNRRVYMVDSTPNGGAGGQAAQKARAYDIEGDFPGMEPDDGVDDEFDGMDD